MFLDLLIESVKLRPVPHAVALDLRVLAPQRWVDRPWALQRRLVPAQRATEQLENVHARRLPLLGLLESMAGLPSTAARALKQELSARIAPLWSARGIRGCLLRSWR